MPGALLVVLIAVLAFLYVRSTDQKVFDKTSKEATMALYDGKPATAESEWRTYLGRAFSKEHKYEAWQGIALAQLNQKKYKEAISSYKNQEKYGQLDISAESGIAVCAEQMNDKKTAVEYYKRVLSDLKKQEDNPGRTMRIHDTEQRIQNLGGTL